MTKRLDWLEREVPYPLHKTVTFSQAYRALGMGRTKAYQLAHANAFPLELYRFGTRIKVLRTDLDRVIGNPRRG